MQIAQCTTLLLSSGLGTHALRADQHYTFVYVDGSFRRRNSLVCVGLSSMQMQGELSWILTLIKSNENWVRSPIAILNRRLEIIIRNWPNNILDSRSWSHILNKTANEPVSSPEQQQNDLYLEKHLKWNGWWEWHSNADHTKRMISIQSVNEHCTYSILSRSRLQSNALKLYMPH